MKADDATLGPMLAHLHRHMRRELDAALLAACGRSAGVWDRWGAVRLLDTLRPCLRAERDLVDRVIQGGADFVHAAEKYRLAFEYWCREVGGSVGPVGRDAAPADVVDRLQALAPHTAVV